jgi:protein involved in plasmid replication-relaxation
LKFSDALQLQDRDVALLRALFECRVMTNDHAAALFFDGKDQAAKKRLQKLKTAGHISERPRRAFEPSVLFLTRKSLTILQEKGVLAEYPSFDLPVLERRARVSNQTIRHELEVMDVKTAFHSAIKSFANFAIAEFSTWPLLNEFNAYRPGGKGAEVTVKPDGFIRIHETEADGGKFERTFFLEVDRSTEMQEVLTARAGRYFDYYKRGGFAVRNGAARSDFKDFPFRVLMVFKTAERRNNTAERLLQNNPPILTQVCLSTFEEVTKNPFGAIWFCPADYRDAVKGTPFEVEPHRGQQEYQRQTARELFVEKKVRKLKILADDAKA